MSQRDDSEDTESERAHGADRRAQSQSLKERGARRIGQVGAELTAQLSGYCNSAAECGPRGLRQLGRDTGREGPATALR